MGAHKGKSFKDKASKTRYWSEGHRVKNKIRRILRCNGEEFLAAWKARYAPEAGAVAVKKISVGGRGR